MSKSLLRSCPLLERASESQPLPYAPFPWSLRRCSDTGFVYLANPPAQDLFRDTFAWEVTHKTESRRRQQAEPAVHAMSEAAKTFRRRVLKRDKVAALGRRIACTFGTGPIRLVDVGCAEGTLIERVVEGIPADVADRVEPIGIEISTHLASVAGRTLSRRGGRCIHATGIEGLAMLEPASVHMIVLSCILEHEIEPLTLLRHCRERLTADGSVIVKVPNFNCLGRLIRGRKWCGFRWPDHVNYFTATTLASMARSAGFDVVRMGLFDRSPLSDSLYAVLGGGCSVQSARKAA
ncbi:MAG: methyltransferase domain-containing protein [Planctomycetia bacterium]|nr:methyltransferase domain-containing protein [Planctomycetia bacterium]